MLEDPCAPKHHFYAFDVCDYGTYLVFAIVMYLLQRSGFQCLAAPVCRANFAGCMAIDVDRLPTKLPYLLGLPPCTSNSIADGTWPLPSSRRPAPKDQ